MKKFLHKVEARTLLGDDSRLFKPELMSAFTDTVAASVGLGKSRTALRLAVELLVRMRRSRNRQTVVYAVPTLSLADELAEYFNQLSAAKTCDITSGVWRGRAALRPECDGHTMCSELDHVREVEALSLNV